jgi:hypothetical protein
VSGSLTPTGPPMYETWVTRSSSKGHSSPSSESVMARPIGVWQAFVQDVTRPMRNTSLAKPQCALVNGT